MSKMTVTIDVFSTDKTTYNDDGHQSEAEINALLVRIAALPKRNREAFARMIAQEKKP